MAYRTLTDLLSKVPIATSPLAVPLQATSPAVAHKSLRPLDSLPTSGRRVLLELGLRGGDKFLVLNGVDPNSPSRIYPDKSSPRVAGRLHNVSLTPGHLVALEVVAVPSGPCQRDEVALFVPDGAGGSIEVEVTYANGDGQSVTCQAAVDLAASQLPRSAESPAGYYSLIVSQAVAIPTPLIPSAEHWQKWTRGGDVTASAVVRYVGSPRPVDVVLVEVPHSIVVDTSDSRWPAAMYSANGQPYAQPPSDYPIEQLSATDPGGGTRSIRRALRSFGRELGPCLFGWSSAAEHVGDLDDWISYDTGSGDDEAPPASVTGTTLAEVMFGGEKSSSNLFGWSTGNYARDVDHGDAFLDGRTGVLPVWVAAYCRVSGGTGTYRLRTDDVGWSEIVWSTTATSWTWVLTPGWLEVGTGPEDAPPARLWASNSGANDTQIRDLIVFKRVRG